MKWREFLTPVKSLTTREAKAFINEHREGTFTLLDVRQPGEYEKSRLPGATLIPLPELFPSNTPNAVYQGDKIDIRSQKRRF